MRLTFVALSLISFASCGPIDDADVPPAPEQPAAESKQEVVTSNGTNLNGTNLNGTNLNGTNLNGTNLNGTNLNGTNLNGTNLNGTTMNGTNLNGTALASILARVHLAYSYLGPAPLQSAWLARGELRGSDGGNVYGGEKMVGAEFWGELGDGNFVPIRVANAAPDSSGGGVWRYAFEYQKADSTWASLCGSSSAIVVPGYWNYLEGVPGGGSFTDDSSVFTVGCPGAAVEKCVKLGYRPWKDFWNTAGSDLHASCVRAIRADFCGDGQSWTVNGRQINLYDDVGIQYDTRWWISEAEWVPRGTRCVSLVARNLLGLTCSGLVATLSCGAKWHFDSGTLLMTETSTGPLGISIFGW